MNAYPEYERKLPRLAQAELTQHTDELGRDFYTAPDGRRVCGRLKKAKNRAIENEACLAPPTSIGPCRVHGGASPGGRMTAGGRYGRSLRKWKRPFVRALADRELLDARREVAMMDVLLERLAVRAERGDSPEWRAQLLEQYEALDEAVRGMRHSEVGPRLKALGDAIKRGATGDQARRELMEQLERRTRCSAKLTEIELKREQKLTQAEVVAQIGVFIGVLQTRLEPVVMQKLLPYLQAALPSPALVEAAVSDGED